LTSDQFYKLSWFPFFHSDWFGSAAIRVMPVLAEFAYFRLIIHAASFGGYFHDDEELIRTTTRLTPEQWASVRDIVMKQFAKTDDGLYYNQVLLKHLKKFHEKYQGASERAREAINKRWAAERAKENTNVSTNESTNVIQTITTPTTTPTTTSTTKTKGSKTSKPLELRKRSSGIVFDEKPCPDDLPEYINPDRETAPVGVLSPIVKKHVFEYYLEKLAFDPVLYKWTEKRRSHGVARLRDLLQLFQTLRGIGEPNVATSLDIMRGCVDVMLTSDWHMGRDPRTHGKTFNEWDHLFRSYDQMEKWIRH
jgi:uncharacterized protein YdaU (DUF1376 family)